MADSALFAFMVYADVPGMGSESVLEISADRIPLDDKKPIATACHCAIVDLGERYGADVVKDAKVSRVYAVTMTKKLVRGKPTKEEIAAEKAEAEAEAKAEADAKAKEKSGGKTT